jgi:hypothetical protein
MECLGLQNKPKAEVHPGHKLTGPKEEEEEEEILPVKLASLAYSKTSPNCMEVESSLPYSQQPENCVHSQVDQCSHPNSNLFL